MSVIVAKPSGGCSSSGSSADNYTFLYDENVIGGVEPSAQGTNSIALGSGALTNATATEAIAIGDQSLARIPGSIVQASGSFSARGDAQTGRYLLRNTTTDNVSTEAFIDGAAGTQRLVLPDNTTWTFKATVAARRIDVTDGHAGYTLQGVVYRNVGPASIAIQGKVSKSIVTESNRSWDINIDVDVNTGALVVFTVGQNGKTVRWLTVIETVEVSG
jgi:hypothetical protein